MYLETLIPEHLVSPHSICQQKAKKLSELVATLLAKFINYMNRQVFARDEMREQRVMYNVSKMDQYTSLRPRKERIGPSPALVAKVGATCGQAAPNAGLQSKKLNITDIGGKK